MQTIVLPVSARDLFHLFHVEFPLGAGNKLVAHGRGKSLDSGQFKLRLPRSLHRQLALQSKREGVSMNQFCVLLLSQNNAARA